MSFSACVLTAGLLLATAATVSCSSLNPFVKTFGVLDDADILPRTKECPNPQNRPIGTCTNLTVTDCSPAPGGYPCVYLLRNTYHVKPTFTCEATLTSCQLIVTKFGFPVLTLNSDSPVSCIAGQSISPVFTHTVGFSDPPATFELNYNFLCDGPTGQKLECCRKVISTTTWTL